MKLNAVFDLVAPIAIYHRTDVRFKKKAMRAWRDIKKLPDIWQTFDLQSADSSWELDDPEMGNWALESYTNLFEQIVLTCFPKWTFGRDHYGARCVNDEKKERVFSGDDTGAYPWYETTALLVERLMQYTLTSDKGQQEINNGYLEFDILEMSRMWEKHRAGWKAITRGRNASL